MDDVLRSRFQRQLLGSQRARGAAGVAERLLAVQAQDLRSARIAVRARAAGIAAGEIERACTEERSLVVGWLNRGTLHLVRSEDYWWLHALTTPPLFTANARRLAQTGVGAPAAERGVQTIARALADEGPLTRYDLRDRLDRARVPTAGQALVHVLMLACLRGLAVRGPFVGGRQAYVLAAEWLPKPRTVDRAVALGELASRYLAGHAPADDRDLAKWAGLPLRDARAGLERVASRRIPDDEREAAPRPCLLDQWDPVLVGWRTRNELLRAYPGADSANTQFRPFAYVDARAVATWRAGAGVVQLGAPFARISRAARQALDRDAADLQRFLTRR
jgi:Winged helix DNA-binding domain